MKSLNTIILTAIAAVCVGSCAKTPETDYGKLAQMEFDAWISVNKQAGWQETPLGSWIIEISDDPSKTPAGTVDEFPYMSISHTVRTLGGTVNSTTVKEVAQQIGTYKQQNYYGPQISYRGSNGVYAGLDEIIGMLHEGGSCKVIIPGWLLTNSRYSTKQKYLDNMTSTTSALVYEITLDKLIPDIEAWELGLVKDALGADIDKADSLAEGVFYLCDRPADSEEDFTSDDKIYINYVCRRLLDGQGVDTNMADSAKVFGTYKSGSTYGPVLINWASEASQITMTSSNTSVIKGFSTALFHMRAHEKGRAFMTSTYGYTSNGSGDAIPSFCPLIFEIEFVDK